MDSEIIRPKPDGALGWAYRPDAETNAALSRGRTKLKNLTLGAGRPHEGGNMAEALAEARKAEAKRYKPKRKGRNRRRQVVKLVSKKRSSSKRTAAPSKKKAVRAEKHAANGNGNGKMIPLKTICSQLDLDPKATRVKLRRLIAKGDIKWHDPNARWEFTPARAKEIKEHLTE